MTHTLYHGDCLDILPTLPAQSVDAIIADPPYGQTACKWDSVIPLDAMWPQLQRVVKPNGAIVLFASQPFTSALVMSNPVWFRYEWVWIKNRGSNFQWAKRMPMKRHESILVFGHTLPQFNLELTQLNRPVKNSRRNKGANLGHCADKGDYYQQQTGYAFSDLFFDSSVGKSDHVHPTQKPVELLRYLVRTYTNPGETVLDFTMGSGTTGVACAMEGRNFIGVELDAGYFDIAKRRIEQVQPALMEAAD